jgi:3-hydroxyisobutyrate dehydrogenase
MKISFLGLGTMGYPMAAHLQRAGYNVCVYNRTTLKAQQWVKEYGGSYKMTPSQAVLDADIIFMCLGNDQDVENVVTGENGVFAGIKASAMIVDHTTTSSMLAQKLSALASDKEVHFIDAPVSGGQAGAENGQLAIMIGGDQNIVESITPVMDVYAKSITYMGKSGAGQATKMVNQVLIAGILQGISEGFALAEKSGLNIPQVIEAISAGAAGSWQLNNRGLNICHDKFDYGFAIDWMRKDLGFCLDAAKQYGIDLPNVERVDQCYADLQKQGYHRCDTSVLVKQYDK